MEDWIERLARELGDEPLTEDEVSRLLAASREVAHRVERKITPLSTFLLGAAVGRATEGGATRPRALEGALAAFEALLPPAGEA